jgi:hypothetical protein
MPRYRVLEKSFIIDRIVEAGEEVEYDGWPGHNLEPLDAAAREKKREYDEEINPARIAKLRAENPTPGGVEQENLAKLIGEAVALAMAAQNAVMASGDATLKAAIAKDRAARAKATNANSAVQAKADAEAAAAAAVAEEAAKNAQAAVQASDAALA